MGDKNPHIEVSVPGQRKDFEKWIAERGGVQVWSNAGLSNPGACLVFTPATTADGKQYPKPHWSVIRGPVVEDIDSFRFVVKNVEVDRFKVKTARGPQELQVKLTKESTDRVRNRCKAAKDRLQRSVYYEFDYTSRECMISVPIFEGEDEDGIVKGVAPCTT